MGKVSTMFPKFEQRRKRVGLNEKRLKTSVTITLVK